MELEYIVFVICVNFALSNWVLGGGSVKDQEKYSENQYLNHESPSRETTFAEEISNSKQPSVFLTPPPSLRHSLSDLNFLSNDSEYLEVESTLREKRQERQDPANARTFSVDVGIGPGFPPGSIPLCFEREVKGTCRYRSSPDECFRHEWTAYATIINEGYKKITSIPEGLLVHPGGHPRVRVFLKMSCCTPIVQFVAYDLFLQPSPCLVDVRELQDLHWGEIVGIVVGCLLFIIVLIVVIALCLRYQRRKREKETVIFGRSLTRSKSGTGSMNHHR